MCICVSFTPEADASISTSAALQDQRPTECDSHHYWTATSYHLQVKKLELDIESTLPNLTRITKVYEMFLIMYLVFDQILRTAFEKF